jgi:hypothetical protein
VTATEIPLQGGSLEHLERRGTWLVVTLAAEGAGRVQLLFFNGEAHGTVESLPLALATGTLETPEGPLGSRIPLPFPHAGAVELHLEGGQGERLTIVGQSLIVRSSDPGNAVVPLGRSSAGGLQPPKR